MHTLQLPKEKQSDVLQMFSFRYLRFNWHSMGFMGIQSLLLQVNPSKETPLMSWRLPPQIHHSHPTHLCHTKRHRTKTKKHLDILTPSWSSKPVTDSYLKYVCLGSVIRVAGTVLCWSGLRIWKLHSFGQLHYFHSQFSPSFPFSLEFPILKVLDNTEFKLGPHYK